MRILIVEDDALIAMDLEDIVASHAGYDPVLASNVEGGLAAVEQGIDFALLDLHLGARGVTSLPIAERLLAQGLPFCFVTASQNEIPAAFTQVPIVAKPFHRVEIERVLPAAGRRVALPRYARLEAGTWAITPRHQA